MLGEEKICYERERSVRGGKEAVGGGKKGAWACVEDRKSVQEMREESWGEGMMMLREERNMLVGRRVTGEEGRCWKRKEVLKEGEC